MVLHLHISILQFSVSNLQRINLPIIISYKSFFSTVFSCILSFCFRKRNHFIQIEWMPMHCAIEKKLYQIHNFNGNKCACVMQSKTILQLHPEINCKVRRRENKIVHLELHAQRTLEHNQRLSNF